MNQRHVAMYHERISILLSLAMDATIIGATSSPGIQTPEPPDHQLPNVMSKSKHRSYFTDLECWRGMAHSDPPYSPISALDRTVWGLLTVGWGNTCSTQ